MSENLPKESLTKVNYHWPVVKAYTDLQVAKEQSNSEVMEVMKAYMDTKTLLVREKKALIARVKEYLDELDAEHS